MNTGHADVKPQTDWRRGRWRRDRAVRSAVEVVLFGVLPVFANVLLFAAVAGDDRVTDFENAFYPAASAILDGRDPYPSPTAPELAAGTEYVYPPLTALLTVPFTTFPVEVAGLLVMVGLLASVVATLLVLGIRDWRCYGLALLWPPVLSAVQTGNITLLLGLAAAVTWRLRDSVGWAGLGLGASLAAKLIMWPLAIWLAATSRMRAALVSVAVGALGVGISWAVIGFDGLRRYPEILDRLRELEEGEAYTAYALALDFGASPGFARAAGWTIAAALVVGVVILGRRGEDRRSFVLATAAALACSPIVWLHYFALLLVPVAVSERRLGLAWFVPLLMFFSTGTYNGSTLQTALTLTAAALTIAVALRLQPRSTRRADPAWASQ